MKRFKPNTPGRRGMTGINYRELLSGDKPEKSLTKPIKKTGGRSRGQISVRHRGGGAKRRWRSVDFKRADFDILAKVETIEYDPSRTSFIAKILYKNGKRAYIIASQNMKVGDEELVFGFSSGTYARLNPMMAGLGLVPRQEEIDALETGLSVSDWEKRYEFIYQRAKDENIVTIMGVAPVQTGFARYMKKEHEVYPRDIWDMKVLYTTSVAKVHTKYKPVLQRMYGEVSVVEMYTATEGAFGQQMDDYPYWVAKSMGYFGNVETKLEPGPSDGTATVKFVALGQADMGFPSPGVFSFAIENDMDLVSVFNMGAVDVFDFAFRPLPRGLSFGARHLCLPLFLMNC